MSIETVVAILRTSCCRKYGFKDADHVNNHVVNTRGLRLCRRTE